jgi:hypothetical protein
MTLKAIRASALAVTGLASMAASAQGIGAGPGATPSKERSVPAEMTMATAKDPKWKVPRAEGAEIFNINAGG